MKWNALMKGIGFGMVPMFMINVLLPLAITTLSARDMNHLMAFGTGCGILFTFIGYELSIKK